MNIIAETSSAWPITTLRLPKEATSVFMYMVGNALGDYEKSPRFFSDEVYESLYEAGFDVDYYEDSYFPEPIHFKKFEFDIPVVLMPRVTKEKDGSVAISMSKEHKDVVVAILEHYRIRREHDKMSTVADEVWNALNPTL